MGSDRLVRQLCWTLVVLAIITAIMSLGITFALFVPFPDIPDGTDFVERLVAIRAADGQLFPFVLIGSVASAVLFAVVALLGVALRPFASGGAWRDVMATLFVVGGTVGIVGQALNVAMGNAATFGYCDCGYKTEELIAQDYALSIGWTAVNWLLISTVTLVGVGAAVAGRILDVSPAFRALSYLIAAVLLFAVALRLLASLVFIPAFDPFQVSDLAVAVASGILVPIWAVVLARNIHRLRIWTAGIAATPATEA